MTTQNHCRGGVGRAVGTQGCLLAVDQHFRVVLGVQGTQQVAGSPRRNYCAVSSLAVVV